MTFTEVADILLLKEYKFAKSMPSSPHWYTLRDKWGSGETFEKVVKFIREHAYIEYFYGKPYRMFNLNGYKYWTMGAPLSETILINRTHSTYKTEYDKIAKDYQNLFTEEEHIAENKEVISMLDIKGKVIDIGCGDGLLLDYLPIAPKDYTGIDISKEMLLYHSKKHPKHINSVINTAFEDFYIKGYDTAISLFSSASYIDPSILIDRLSAIMNKGGNAFLMFYADSYVPVTHTKLNIAPLIFKNNFDGEIYKNYKIVKINF